MVNTTVIGCSWVITTRPFASLARTMLPASTWRRPRRPAIGAVTRAVDELQLGVVDQALIEFDHAFVLAHQRFLRVDQLLGDRILGEQHAVALKVDAGVGEQRLVTRHLPFILGELVPGTGAGRFPPAVHPL